jgi:predicted  nucleic acid-binding Zn-ribbon protein
MSPAHFAKLQKEITALTARLVAAEKKIAALEKSTVKISPHLSNVERRDFHAVSELNW